MSMWAYAAAVVACGVGAVGRDALRVIRRPDQGPWPTIVANAVGSAILGAAAGAVHGGAPQWVLLVAGAGLAGGLTTFSALALDAATMWVAKRRGSAATYLAVTLVSGVASVWLGWTLVA